MKTLLTPTLILLLVIGLCPMITAQELPQSIEIDTPEFDDGQAGMAQLLAESEAYLAMKNDDPITDESYEIDHMIQEGEDKQLALDEARMEQNDQIRESAIHNELVTSEISMHNGEYLVRCSQAGQYFTYPIFIHSADQSNIEEQITNLSFRIQEQLSSIAMSPEDIDSVIVEDDRIIIMRKQVRTESIE